MARSDRKRIAVAAVIALAVPLVVACNGIIGLSDFEKGECPGARCADGGVPPPDGPRPDVVSDAPPEARGADPVSWAQWRMPNYDGGAEPLPTPLSYKVLDGNRIEDLVTGLVWRRATLPSALAYDDAKKGCATLDPATGPWRLPKRIELVSLLDFAGTTFLIDPLFTGVKNVQVWTSSEHRMLDPKTGRVVVTDAFWTVDFDAKRGAVDVLSTAGGPTASVLCVLDKNK